MKRSIIIALGLAALAAPVANAGAPARLSPAQRIIARESRGGHVAGPAQEQQRSPVQHIIAQEDAGRMTLLRRHAVTAQATPAPVVVTVAAGGFDWGDAGIGGAAAVALVLLGAGGVVLIRDGRRMKVQG
jgi:hypothetical protein